MNKLCYALLVLIILSLNLSGQNVFLNLDENLEDSSGSFTPISNGEVTFIEEEGRKFCRLGPSSVIEFPQSLSEMAFNQNSFELSFDLRVLDDVPIKDDCCWQGFSLFGASEDLPLLNIKMVNFVGFDTEWGYDFYDGLDGSIGGAYVIDDQNLKSWRTLKLRFDIDKKRWQTSLADQQISGVFPENFDFQNFRDLVTSNQIRIKGVNQSDLNVFIDIDNLEINAPAEVDESAITSAFMSLASEMKGESMLTDSEKESLSKEILSNLYYTNYDSILDGLFEYTNTYENLNPPLYEDGQSYEFKELPINDQVLQFSQDFIFQTQFVAGNIENQEGIVFEHAEVAPGLVSASTAKIPEAFVTLDATYNRDIAAELTDQSRVVRPTGYYLAPGDIVTISVPAEFVDQGLSIIVGAHFRNMDYDYIRIINRFPDISAEFKLTETQIKVANPFGGGIYLKVPEGTDLGMVEVKIENAVKSPYFSWKEGSKTSVSDWLDQVASTGAPWADFESDKFMFTIPVDKLAGVNNPDEIMTRWDEMMDAIRDVAGRPHERPRAEYYSFDTRLVTPAYGAGYPMVMPTWEAFRPDNLGWNPLKVLETKPDQTLLHEMGHNHLHPTMSYGGDLDPCHFLEAESIVHMLATSIYSNIYGLDVNGAFMESGVGQKFGFYQAAFDWIITNNFRTNERIYEDTSAPLEESEMLRYQPRSWAKYAEIAYLFGWEALSKVNGQFYTLGVEQTSNVCDWRGFVVGRDDYIKAATEALGVNMTPLFHFWGINPSPELAEELSVYPQSEIIKARIIEYRDSVAPRTLEDYMVYHDIFPVDDYQYPRYEQYLQEFDEDFAAEIQVQLEYLLETYFPAPRTGSEIEIFNIPEASSSAEIDTVNKEINITLDANTDLTELTPSYTLSPGARANINGVFQQSTVSVVDFSSPVIYEVEAEDQINTTDWTVIATVDSSSSTDNTISNYVTRIFPNPFKEGLQISFGELLPSAIEVYDITGRLQVQIFDVNTETMNIKVSGPSGIYILKVQWEEFSSNHRIVKQ